MENYVRNPAEKERKRVDVGRSHLWMGRRKREKVREKVRVFEVFEEKAASKRKRSGADWF